MARANYDTAQCTKTTKAVTGVEAKGQGQMMTWFQFEGWSKKPMGGSQTPEEQVTNWEKYKHDAVIEKRATPICAQ